MTGPKRNKTAGRTYKITAQRITQGWIDTHNDHKHGRGYVILPTITWAGEVGYWHDVQVTEALCAANDASMPTLPDLNMDRLDTIPAHPRQPGLRAPRRRRALPLRHLPGGPRRNLRRSPSAGPPATPHRHHHCLTARALSGRVVA